MPPCMQLGDRSEYRVQNMLPNVGQFVADVVVQVPGDASKEIARENYILSLGSGEQNIFFSNYQNIM